MKVCRWIKLPGGAEAAALQTSLREGTSLYRSPPQSEGGWPRLGAGRASQGIQGTPNALAFLPCFMAREPWARRNKQAVYHADTKVTLRVTPDAGSLTFYGEEQRLKKEKEPASEKDEPSSISTPRFSVSCACLVDGAPKDAPGHQCDVRLFQRWKDRGPGEPLSGAENPRPWAQPPRVPGHSLPVSLGTTSPSDLAPQGTERTWI